MHDSVLHVAGQCTAAISVFHMHPAKGLTFTCRNTMWTLNLILSSSKDSNVQAAAALMSQEVSTAAARLTPFESNLTLRSRAIVEFKCFHTLTYVSPLANGSRLWRALSACPSA